MNFFHIHQNILANSFNLISGFISIKFLQFTPHSGKLLLDNRILTFQPLISSKHWRFLCNLWSIKLNLVILERSIHRMNVLDIFQQRVQLLLLYHQLGFLIIESFLVIMYQIFNARFLVLIFCQYNTSCSQIFLQDF